jgi:single-stranded-DNA-specific exonuclease
VVGIVAGRLKERFGKPSFVAGFEGGMGRGSARSIPGIDVGGAIRAAVLSGVIESGGGHAMAAGFSLSASQLNSFQRFLEAAFEGQAAALAAAATLELDTVASPAGAGAALLEELALAGPYGAGNPEPLLAFPDLRLNGGGAVLQAIAFRAVGTPLGEGLLESRGQAIHAAGRLKRNEWNGQVTVQLEIEDAAPASA